MRVSREEIIKVASLAKLELAEENVEILREKFIKVLDFAELLNEVDTTNVTEMAHPVDVHSVLRDDQVGECLPRESALSNAPKSDGEFFLVPPVLG